MAELTAAVALTASLSPAYSRAAALEFSPSHQTALRCSLAHAASSAAALPMAEMFAPVDEREASQSIDIRDMKKGVGKLHGSMDVDDKGGFECHKGISAQCCCCFGCSISA